MTITLAEKLRALSDSDLRAAEIELAHWEELGYPTVGVLLSLFEGLPLPKYATVREAVYDEIGLRVAATLA